MSLIIPFFIHHRGCPHRCLFCNQLSIAGANREESGDVLVDLGRTIDQWLARSKPQTDVQVAFYGGSFSCLDEEIQAGLLGKAGGYLKSGKIHGLRLSTRPDCVTEEIVDFLVAGGVRTIEIGAQSMNDEVLRQAVRGHTSADTVRAVRLLGAKKVETGIQLMAGLPGETTRSFMDGIRRVIELSPQLVRLYPTLVLEHTELAAHYRRCAYRPLSLARAVSLMARARTMLEDRQIKVIRVGLQPTEELEKQLIAGPYHPSFGELVNSRCWYHKIRPLLVKAGCHSTVHLTIGDRDFSALVGHRRENLQRLENLVNGARLQVHIDPAMKRGRYNYIVDRAGQDGGRQI